MADRPGGELSSRPLHFIWICDCSGSMSEKGKIQSLNQAIRECIPEMQKVAKANPNAQVLVRAITFSSGATWHIAKPVPIEDFKWIDMSAGGVTDMGKAFSLLAKQLTIPPMEKRGLPPVIVLLSDGQPTDDYRHGLREILDRPWGKKAVRIGIAIGDDADKNMLQEFIAHPEIPVYTAKNADQLFSLIKWASTAVLKAASAPPSQAKDDDNGKNVPVPAPPGIIDPEDEDFDDEVW